MQFGKQGGSSRHSLAVHLKRAARSRLLNLAGRAGESATMSSASELESSRTAGGAGDGAGDRTGSETDDTSMHRECGPPVGIFRGAAGLEPHISRALNNGVVPLKNAKEKGAIFNRCFGSFDRHGQSGALSEGLPTDIHLSGTHAIGPRTTVDMAVNATCAHSMEMRVKITQARIGLLPARANLANCMGQVSAVVASDMRKRHQIAVEAAFGEEADDHSLSTIIASDFITQPSWGIASSHRLKDRDATVFCRYSSDDYSGRRIILQSVHKLSKRNTVSPICAVTVGSFPEAGVSWSRIFGSADDGKNENSVQVKALLGADGEYALTLQLKIGEVE